MPVECPVRNLRIEKGLRLNCDGCEGEISDIGSKCSTLRVGDPFPITDNAFVRANLEKHYPQIGRVSKSLATETAVQTARADNLLTILQAIPLSIFNR